MFIFLILVLVSIWGIFSSISTKDFNIRTIKIGLGFAAEQGLKGRGRSSPHFFRTLHNLNRFVETKSVRTKNVADIFAPQNPYSLYSHCLKVNKSSTFGFTLKAYDLLECKNSNYFI